ncbi:transposase [Lactobacillus helveticus]|uniref:transposase n=1 Tax=Lactobacillus helveticus TaxID=1587 RepID=UPI0012BD81EB|nr:transposase [Lactobacillus helveticus]
MQRQPHLSTRQDGVLRYFSFGRLHSNGCLEGFNRKIKQIERTAFGYSNFTNLLTRIRLEEDLYKEKEPNSLLMVA